MAVTGMADTGKIYGYVAGQNAKDQIEALRALNIDDSRIVVEKGKCTKFQRLVERLKPGDTLTVVSIDSLADISGSLELLSKKQGVILDILDMPLMSGRSADDPVRPFLSTVIIQSFLYFSQRQVSRRKARQRAGIDNARAKGVKFGRRKTEVPDGFQEIAGQWKAGEITAKAAAERLGISRTSFYGMVKEIK